MILYSLLNKLSAARFPFRWSSISLITKTSIVAKLVDTEIQQLLRKEIAAKLLPTRRKYLNKTIIYCCLKATREFSKAKVLDERGN